VPRGMTSWARSGSNPFLPKEVARKLHKMARDVQQARAPELQPQG